MMHRREALRSLATGALAGGVAIMAMPPAEAGTQAVSEAVNTCFAEYLAARADYETLDQAYDAALQSLPAWAAPGPEHMNFDGERVGRIVGSPEVENIGIPGHPIAFRLIRPSFESVMQDHPLMPLSGSNRLEWRKAKFANVRRWIARRRAQQAERHRVGLTSINAAMDVQSKRRWAAINGLRGIQDQSGNADYAVAVLLIAVQFHDDDNENDFGLALRCLAPLATGCVKEEALRVLAEFEAS